MRPGQLLTAVTYAGSGLCIAGLIVLRLWRPEIDRITTD